MLYHLPGLVNIQKANWKITHHAILMGKSTNFRLGHVQFRVFHHFLDATALTCLKKTKNCR